MKNKMLKIRLMGIVKDKWNRKYLEITNFNADTYFIEILKSMSNNLGEKFWEFFDRDYSPKRGIIIMIDGADFKVKGGLDSLISSKSEITILSVIHGG